MTAHRPTPPRRPAGRAGDAGLLARAWLGLAAFCARRRAEAELRAMDARELGDLALDRGGIGYAARHGRTPR
ncbi:hypothetical protein EZJ19_08820 [Parasulfuritortus cantonensis]|uniref:DUF1127 domain-containing protein n=1 Tax=Parasulfuritortus cantonensis TaxID=2528202 RepID=A0A4R1BD30_9PROT|nr:hypothetical protein [Parasulfuritortus cantonensis]TCJ14971.1 hypothetical protein EZJ19_08820 [Parasulfuritortus cantonensis]